LAKHWLWGGIGLLLLYTVVPWVLTRIFGIGVYRKGHTGKKIALTFDDGPDPVYTPRLLDLLKEKGIQATFFVLGEKAEKYPGLIERMHKEGHQIGIHNYRHLSNWLLTPRSVWKRQVEKSAQIVQDITGIRPEYYRPPWGILNLFDLWLLKRYRIVLWSLMLGDWRSRIGPERLAYRLIRRVRDGDIILLHDSGETFGADLDAPEQTIRALEIALDEWKARGLECIRISEMERRSREYVHSLRFTKRMLLAVWMRWEHLFERLFHIEPIDRSNPLLKLRIRKFRGSRPIVLPDGEVIRHGDLVAELHFDNELLLHIGSNSNSSVHLAIQIIRRAETLMPQMGQMIHRDPKYREVKGLYGISILHRGVKQLGFTVIGMPKSLFSFVTRYYLRWLMYVIHPLGRERLKLKPDEMVPKIIAMSRKELVSRYCGI